MAKDIARYTDRQMMKDFDRMLDSFFGHGDRMPSVDIRQDRDSYVVRARVAGYRPDELNAYVEDADEQRLEASCRKGVLELVVPKKAKAEPRRIEVKVN